MRRGDNAMGAVDYTDRSSEYTDGNGRTWKPSASPGHEFSFDEPWMAKVYGDEFTMQELDTFVASGAYEVAKSHYSEDQS